MIPFSSLSSSSSRFFHSGRGSTRRLVNTYVYPTKSTSFLVSPSRTRYAPSLIWEPTFLTSTSCGFQEAATAPRLFSTLGGNNATASTPAGQPPLPGGSLPSASTFSPAASAALRTIKDSLTANKLSAAHEVPGTKRKKIRLSVRAKKELQGNVWKYCNNHDRPEFHNIDKNRHGRVFEPTDTFEVVISSSKNNLWIVLNNKARGGRTVFSSHAGNVGQRGPNKKTRGAASRVALNVARKCKRLGVQVVEVRFRRLLKVEIVLQAFKSLGLKVIRLSHIPRLPKGDPPTPRKRRRL